MPESESSGEVPVSRKQRGGSQWGVTLLGAGVLMLLMYWLKLATVTANRAATFGLVQFQCLIQCLGVTSEKQQVRDERSSTTMWYSVLEMVVALISSPFFVPDVVWNHPNAKHSPVNIRSTKQNKHIAAMTAMKIKWNESIKSRKKNPSESSRWN